MTFFTKLNKNDLMKAVRKAGISSEVEAASVLAIFQAELKKVCGSDLAGEVRPLCLRVNTVTVEVRSSLIVQEVSFKEQILLAAVNRQLEQVKVNKISWRVS